MRVTSPETQEVWESGRFTGAARPMVRATIQQLSVMLCSYGQQLYSSIPFGQADRPIELPNIKSVKWNRTTEGNVATMTMQLFNTEPMPIGSTPEPDLDRPGYYTYQRGTGASFSRWGHATNVWQNRIVPDRIIRTYEGYGFNPAVAPEADTNLYLSGTWLIDDVIIDSQGMITVECRDIGRALLDQILLPPVVPMTNYPLFFERFRDVPNPPIVSTSTAFSRPAYDSSSNTVWVGHPGTMFGHDGPDAFDADTASYWLSCGNSAPDRSWSFEWIQGKFSSRTVSGVRVRTWGGPYLCYVSVYAGGKWQGTKTVPYKPGPHSGPNASNVRYVATFTAGRETATSFALPKAITGATKIRLTFTKLTRSSIGRQPQLGPYNIYYYRAGVRTLEVASQVTVTTPGGTRVEPATTPPGVGDFTDIVKLLLAWAGWFWPNDSQRAFVTSSAGTRTTIAPGSSDPVLAPSSGRVWGDFEPTGTMSIAPLGVDVWDKKPIMDGINTIRDMTGYIFFIDEAGGAVFRSPNIWSIGNWVGLGGSTSGRTTDIIEIDDKKTLLSLGATLSSRSIREKIFVGNLAGQVAGMSKGHNPFPSGLRRIGGWTDGHFQTLQECQIMADLIALRQLFTYRGDKVRIPGNPAIQVDDQVRIYERISAESYLHYVKTIGMEWDIETGKYIYDLTTHWLGETPFSDWTFDPETMAPETIAYLQALGRIPA